MYHLWLLQCFHIFFHIDRSSCLSWQSVVRAQSPSSALVTRATLKLDIWSLCDMLIWDRSREIFNRMDKKSRSWTPIKSKKCQKRKRLGIGWKVQSWGHAHNAQCYRLRCHKWVAAAVRQALYLQIRTASRLWPRGNRQHLGKNKMWSIPGTGAPDGCEPWCGFWELSLQPVCLPLSRLSNPYLLSEGCLCVHIQQAVWLVR